MENTSSTHTAIPIPPSFSQTQEAQSMCPPKHLTLMWGGATVGVTGLIALIYGLGNSSLAGLWEMAYLIYGGFMCVSGIISFVLGYNAIPPTGHAVRVSWSVC